MNYAWTPSEGEQVSVLQAIHYGDVEIVFQTETRPDPLTVATGDGLVKNSTRLQVIDELVGDDPANQERIRAYALRYRLNSPAWATRQSFLVSMQQYGSDATISSDGVSGPTSLPATTFTAPSVGSPASWMPRAPVTVADWATGWQAGPDDSERFAATLNGGSQGEVAWPNPNYLSATWTALDLNGDHRTDFAQVTSVPWFSFKVQVELTMPNGGYQGFSKLVVLSPASDVRDKTEITPLAGDVNGDGFQDLTIAARVPNWKLATLFGGSSWDASGIGSVGGDPPSDAFSFFGWVM